MSSFEERLHTALKASEISRNALAKAMGITHQAVTQALSGNTKAFSAANNAAAARILGVNADWLATGKGPKENPQGRLGALTDDEVALIEVLRALPHEVRKTATEATMHVANQYLQRVSALLHRGEA